MKKVYKDAELASIIDSSRQLSKPTFLCPSGNKVSEMCCNKSCDSSLHCNEYECEVCSEKHLCCGLSSKNLSKVSNIVNRFSIYRKDVLKNVERVDRKFKELLTKEFEEFVQEFPQYCLENKNKDIFEKIYTKINGENIAGAQAEEFCREIDNKIKNYQTNVPKGLKWYEDKMNELSQQAKKLKKELRESLTEEKNNQIGLQQKKDFKGFDSVILKHPNDDEKIEFLFSSLAEVRPIESLQLLFRGSKDGFKASTFHEKCDNIHDTVVIVRTDGQTNNTIAGYSHYRWNEVKGNYVYDAGKKAFLLQLNRREKYVPQNENCLICCHNDCGPIFGGYGLFGDIYDLRIWDDCNSNNYSSSNFPVTYNLQGPKRILKKKQSITNFIGATNGSNFRVVDYEVFRVVFK